MRRLARLTVLLVVAILPAGALAACSPAATTTAPWATASAAGAATVVPVIINSQLVVGENRMLFSFLDRAGNTPVGSPDRSASVAFIAPGETQPSTATPATFVWAIEGSRGDYIAHVTLASAGDWRAIFVTQAKGGAQEAIGIPFQVQAVGSAIQVGQSAPASRTPTLADVGGDIKQIATDPTPNPAFYQLSVSEAVARHSPFVLVFATPAFCQSAQCGPTLDRVKAAAAGAPSSVVFINVEPYQLTFADGRLQPVLDKNNQLQPVKPVLEWGILSEPWIYTVDRNGIVRGSFEGVVTTDELKAAIAEIAAP